MAIIFNEEGIKDLMPPCVVQKFVNHDARLFKVHTHGRLFCFFASCKTLSVVIACVVYLDK